MIKCSYYSKIIRAAITEFGFTFFILMINLKLIIKCSFSMLDNFSVTFIVQLNICNICGLICHKRWFIALLAFGKRQLYLIYASSQSWLISIFMKFILCDNNPLIDTYKNENNSCDDFTCKNYWFDIINT